MTQAQFARFIRSLPSTASKSFYKRNEDGSVELQGSLVNVTGLIGIGFPIEDLRRIRGDLVIESDARSSLRFSQLQTIDGALTVRGNNFDLGFPALVDVGRHCHLGGRIEIPNLSVVWGDLKIGRQPGLQLPKLRHIAGDLDVQWRADVAPLVLPSLRGVGRFIGLMCVSDKGAIHDSGDSQVVLELPRLLFTGRPFDPFNATFTSPSYDVIEDDRHQASVLNATATLDHLLINGIDGLASDIGPEPDNAPDYSLGL